MMQSLKHFVIGFAAGFLIAGFVLAFLGYLKLHPDLNQLERLQERQAELVVLCFACVSGVFAMCFATRRISRYWLWFTVVFGVISAIPFWENKDGSLLPFATPYVNFGYQTIDGIVLGMHVVISMLVAAVVHWAWLRTRRNDNTV